MSLPSNPDEYSKTYGKRFRMTKDQKMRGLSRAAAFAEWHDEASHGGASGTYEKRADGAYIRQPEAEPAVIPQPASDTRPVLTAVADLCEKEGKCSCKGLSIGYDVDERRIRITDCSCGCHNIEIDDNG